MKSLVIMISGKMGSGKTTLAKQIEKVMSAEKGVEVFQLRFAEALYDMHDAVLKVLSGYGVERPGLVKDGPLLQLLGTEWGRKSLGENIWVTLLKSRVDRLKKACLMWLPPKLSLYIISDVRFENEFLAFPEALTIRLEASKEVRKSRCEMWRDNDTHPSEIGLDEFTKQNKFTLMIDTEKYNEEETLKGSLAMIRYTLQGMKDE